MPPLHLMHRSLDFTFAIRSEYVRILALSPSPPPLINDLHIGNIANNKYDDGADDDDEADLIHFTQIIQYAVCFRCIVIRIRNPDLGPTPLRTRSTLSTCHYRRINPFPPPPPLRSSTTTLRILDKSKSDHSASFRNSRIASISSRGLILPV